MSLQPEQCVQFQPNLKLFQGPCKVISLYKKSSLPSLKCQIYGLGIRYGFTKQKYVHTLDCGTII